MFFSVYFHYQFRMSIIYNALSFLLELLLLNKISSSFSYDNHHTNFSSYFLNICLILWVQFLGLSHLLYSLHVLIKDIKSFIFLDIYFWEWVGNLDVLPCFSEYLILYLCRAIFPASEIAVLNLLQQVGNLRLEKISIFASIHYSVYEKQDTLHICLGLGI